MKTKAVFFDFDGTITHQSNIDTWKALYMKLGLDTGENSSYHQSYVDFINNKYDYAKWCDISANDYINAGLTLDLFNETVKDIKLYDDAMEVFETLANSGVGLYVISGNFIKAIEQTLGDCLKYFKGIAGNEIVFDKTGKMSGIISTKYDYEGKADFIIETMEKMGLSSEEVVFVGNGENDVFAHRSGAKTICINPTNASEDCEKIWDYVIKETDKLSSILQFIE